MIPYHTRTHLIQLSWIIFFWTIVPLFEYLIVYSTTTYLNLGYNIAFISADFYASLISGLTAGIIGGSILVFAWNKWLRVMSYLKALASIFITFTIIYFLVHLIVYGLTHKYGIYPRSDSFGSYLTENIFPILIQYIKWLLVGLMTLVILEVNDKYGPGVFKNFLLGQYFHPKKEERVFMFLDLKSSTSIAERLDNEKYFHFLRDTYQHITSSIIRNKGEIYQYVGDEVVVSWKANDIQNFINCLKCFFEIEEDLKSSDHFQKTYNEQPVFKAGLHGGEVIAGEMGIIKREIAYSGDVLNTTARIQSKCNEYQAKLLISSYVKEKLPEKDFYLINPIGQIELRGKEKELELFKVEIA